MHDYCCNIVVDDDNLDNNMQQLVFVVNTCTAVAVVDKELLVVDYNEQLVFVSFHILVFDSPLLSLIEASSCL